MPVTHKLFQHHCVKCHGVDGTGKAARDSLPRIPDFTKVSWQARRSQAQLLASILDGKGIGMPPMRGPINEEQARDLVAYIQALAPTAEKTQPGQWEGPASFDARFRRLQEQFDELQGQFYKRAQNSPPSVSTKPSESKRSAPRQDEGGLASALPKTETAAAGSTMTKPPQPVQVEPTPTITWSGEDEPAEPSGGESAEPEASRQFSEKLLHWLGQFHYPAVHFPIALLTAAALAELLRIATGNPAFDTVSRFCVWLGGLTAVVAGGFGWLLGGFAVTDASTVMMTHRWLGTSTVAGAWLVLVLSEVDRRTNCQRAHLYFRVTLFTVGVLVLVTGFFGGAVVCGFSHYIWPQ
jgi:uncharacterized membrane protein/cytochrome c553